MTDPIVNAPTGQDLKKAQWERKLLDLGLRNTLINLRLTKTQLPLYTNSLDQLENALADGSDFTVLPRPEGLRMEEFSFDTLDEQNKLALLQAEFAGKRLRSVLTEAELTKTLKELYRSARSSMEENGANTLYLALGTLRWFEPGNKEKPRYAPIILIPIEMVRRSVSQGYVIRLRDDEPQMNITLLEKLKQDFGILVEGVDPLPVDEHGIDIPAVLTALQQAVAEQPEWGVLETACLGIFSFSQFVMWNDLHNRADDLLRNKIVRSLVEGKLAWNAQPLEMGQRVEENNVLLPMPADASQLYAIRAACSGQSFVLHGPPGTGKSQTITSLIANALADGKRVLFVAEKMAALEVVQKRLDSIGIGPFCLELHSNRSKKRDVLEQLRLASEVTKTRPAESFAAKAEQLRQMRSELDGYARQLHKPLPCGSDLHTLIGDYEQYRTADDLTPFRRDFAVSLDAAALEQQRLVLERLIAAGREVGHPNGHALGAVGCTQYSQTLRTALEPTVSAYQQQLKTILPHAQALLAALGEAAPRDMAGVQRLVHIAVQLACWYNMPAAWARTDAPRLYLEEVQKLCAHTIKAKELEQLLLQRFRPEFFQLDGTALLTRYNEVAIQWFLPKFFGMNGLRKQLNLYALAPVSKEELHEQILRLHTYQQEKRAADALFQRYARDLGDFYAGDSTDWGKLSQLAKKALDAAQALHGVFGSYTVMNTLGGKPELKEALLGLWSSYAPLNKAKAEFDTLLGIRQQAAPNWLQGQLELCDTVLQHAADLRSWTAWEAAALEARSLGLDNAVERYLKGLPHDALLPAYHKMMLQALITAAIDDGEALNGFSGAVFNQKIDQYKRMDQQWVTLSRQEIYCRLAAKVPNFTLEAAHSSELGILQRAIKSGGRGTSIRKLFDQIPNLLPRLCPCMLMSPISAAQYLDPEREPFDIVVFDEASQLPTCKAVGVLARGKDAVIVGDPKQMPPTSFFAVNAVDEENLDVEDLESILDDCLALNMPQSHLLWHYRSRHESLIAFSNSHFYENKLFTFPSVNDRESKVRLVPVDGVFERGTTRRNRAEAEAVVEELKRRCHDEALSGQSVGVVTFNISQQNLIDDLLSDACAADPQLETWAFGGEEPVFIKNLENVQGDERDVILFSVGYGPDEEGKVYMNFGPLNRDGGWRRLNVAVSRARCEMVVFSTLRADQIDLSRTKAEGVAALREFLEYAEGRSLASQVATAENKPSGIAEAVCAALREAGYDTDLNVGRSQYRIDIGVVDPQDPEQYLLGILLDGATYGAAKTTRDREIAQTGVLTGLGWQLLRLWCVDWWDDRRKELDRILKTLKDIQNGKVTPEVPAEPLPEPVLAEPAVVVTGKAPLYKAAKLAPKPISAEEFTEPRNRQDILRRIQRVLKAEAPVSASVLTRRVVQSYGIARAGSRIQTHMDELLRSLALKGTRQEDGIFYWHEEQQPDAYLLYRVCGEEDNHRDVREVPVQEVANAICVLLHEQVSMEQEDLLRETAKKLGYTRLGGNVLAALEGGIRYARSRGSIAPGANGAFVLTDAGAKHAEATLNAFRK